MDLMFAVVLERFENLLNTLDMIYNSLCSCCNIISLRMLQNIERYYFICINMTYCPAVVWEVFNNFLNFQWN